MPEITAEGQALLVHVANLVFGRDLAGADHLDPIPGNPVSRFATQPFNAQPLIQAGSAVDRPGRAEVGKLVGPPGLGGNLVFIEPVEQLAAPPVRPAAGARHPGRGPAIAPRRSGASRWSRRSSGAVPGGRRPHRRSPGDTGCRVGHGQRELRGIRESETRPQFHQDCRRFPLGSPGSGPGVCGTGRRRRLKSRAALLPPSSVAEAVSRV